MRREAPGAMALLGRLGLAAAAAALAICVAFFRANGGFRFNPPLEDMPADFGFLVAPTLIALLFQYATPLLVTAGLIAGLAAMRLWTGRLAVASALLALVGYLAFVRSCLEDITAAF